jgi:hypothetical protein
LLQFYLAVGVLIKFSPSNIVNLACRELMLCLGFVFAKEILYIQISHVTETPFFPIQSLSSFVLNGLIFNTFANYLNIQVFNEYYFLIFLLILAFGGYAHMAYSTAMEISNELDIYIFRINKVKPS